MLNYSNVLYVNIWQEFFSGISRKLIELSAEYISILDGETVDGKGVIDYEMCWTHENLFLSTEKANEQGEWDRAQQSWEL